MTQATSGSTVRVHYTGMFSDGTVFDSSKDRDPLEFTLGEGHVIPGFEQGVLGMSPGETKTTTIPADEAYGPRRDDMVLAVPATQFPDDITPEIGLQLQIPQQGRQPLVATITEVNEERVTLDANHPLAGFDLTFNLELVEVC